MSHSRNIAVGDLALAIVMIGLGAAIFSASFGLPEPALEPIGPAAFPFAVSAILILLSGIMAWRAVTGGTRKRMQTNYRQRHDLALIMLAMTIAYFLIMQLGWLSFRWATVLYVFALTAALFDWRPRQLPVAITIALVTGIGLKFVFTEVLFLDLP